MFALLEHDTTAADSPPETHDVHWDLMVQVPGHERLPTWRLAENPLSTTAPIPAKRIKDHRPLYLDYEGEISRGRGCVRRLDRGPATVERLDSDAAVILLAGDTLRGRFEILRAADGQLTFRRSAAATRSTSAP